MMNLLFVKKIVQSILWNIKRTSKPIDVVGSNAKTKEKID